MKDNHSMGSTENHICCVFNYNPLYRFPIYKKIEEVFHVDFYFGDNVFEPIKQFDADLLHGFQESLKVKKVLNHRFLWYKSINHVFKKQYDWFIITGDAFCLGNWLILLYSKIFNKKVLLWCHGVKDEIKDFKLRIFLHLFYHLSYKILLYGNHGVPYMEKLGIPENKLCVFHNSLDTDKQTKIYKRISHSEIYYNYFKNNFPVIIYIGRIQKRKKIEQILDALSLLRKDGYIINFVVVGNVSDDFGFKERVDNLNLQNQIWMYGGCFDEEKNAELIYNASVCVSPGNVGLTCIHSLSYGTPVITNNNFNTQMPEYEAIENGVTGTFFQEDNIIDLANKIRCWTSFSQDQRQLCREKCREKVLNEWSIDYQINMLKAIIK